MVVVPDRLAGEVGDPALKQLEELLAEGLEEDRGSWRDAQLDPRVDHDAVLRVEDLRLGAKEEDGERSNARAVVDVNLSGSHLLLVHEPSRVEALALPIEGRRMDL